MDVQINEDMLREGVNKAIELGLLPRQPVMENVAPNNGIMLEILAAALDAAGNHDMYTTVSSRHAPAPAYR